MDDRVRPSLLEGMRDFQNLLVHLQTVLAELELPILRTGGGLTFSGFSIQADKSAPVDWVGYHIDRPGLVLYQIQDRVLPEPFSLDHTKRLQARQYERTFSFKDSGFFAADERGQMALLRDFIQETLLYLRSLPPEDEGSTGPFIPVLGDRET